MDTNQHTHHDHSAHEAHNEHHDEHSGHSMGHGMGHGSAQMYLQRFWIVTFLLIPLVLINKTISGFIGLNTFGFGTWIGFGIATIIFGFSLVFFRHAWHEIKAREYGMMTLVSLAVGSGYLFSVVSTFVASLHVQFYLEISTLVWVLLFGHYLEAKSSSAAGDALSEMAKLLPKKAHKLFGKDEVEVDIETLVEGDTVIVKSGEKIPADGTVESGTSHVDEALISGESKPVEKGKGEEVIAGSIVTDGSLIIKLSRVGENSTIGQIQKLIATAQGTKPRAQRIADKASAVLTFVAGGTALLTLLVWSVFLGQPFVFAVTLAITVLVIACPHALGLAIPTVTTITTSLAVKNGIFIKDLAKIETIKKVNYVVFDKTGTLTKGIFGVTNIETVGDTNKDEVLRIAASLEQQSSHIIGQSIVKHAKEQKMELAQIDNFKNFAGKGILATISGKEYRVGNTTLMEEAGLLTDEVRKAHDAISQKGITTILVSDTSGVIGMVGLADEIKQESYEVVNKLHTLGLKVAMLTGDNNAVAKNVADTLGIDTYYAQTLPEDKYRNIKDLQDKGNVVLMVGDGVNDAPSLAQADVGVAIGAGTDVAIDAGDVVLTKSNPQDVVRLMVLGRKVHRKIIQNLGWALGYNVVAIPAAAGVFAFWGFFLAPEVGALLMSLSTVIVVANAMTLKKASLEVA
ncbi:MAG TPA: heavy metal translocating P-type ATPase [Candidatus Kaiserbacteria bacterium]|nr:heavy metal translocating P-type ATPase [Candidatus Kaiserbacteria bacterium]